MAATKAGQEKFVHNSLMSTFGTTDILEILGPAGTVPPTQSLAERLKDYWGMHPTCVSRWCRSHIPADLLASLKPFQKTFEAARRAKTNIAKYGNENPFGSRAIKDKIAEKKSEIYAKRAVTCKAKFGGASKSLSPDEILQRLAAYDLEPIDPITGNSDANKEIRVRCTVCGREFTTHWTTSNNRGYHGRGFITCGCQGRKSKLEKYLKSELSALGYAVTSIKPDWLPNPNSPNGRNLEIDLYFPDLSIGIEINGFAFHSIDPDPLGHKIKPDHYHAYKSECALRNGVKLYHYWYSNYTAQTREDALDYCLAVLAGPKYSISPGDTVSRDHLPDPTIIGLPYEDLGPQKFTSIDGHTCYTSGLWKFHV